MLIRSSDSNQYIHNNLSLSSSFDMDENCTNELSSTISTNTFPNSFLIILVLSILCIFGVCFMMFGPLQRSEAHKRIENFTFGRHPIFNVDHREQSIATRYDDSMEFSNI
ncbi:unnamed protein product [Adineta steineri]|uniref:Uncharacterized protein n=1 Tax=Adineta steineri TaxID=433720 RepID=A0A813S3L5_9BILA|nr:unnamed protein product [Adineta steineri]CAF1083126.1 unnamed protein product [Adineta steineri]